MRSEAIHLRSLFQAESEKVGKDSSFEDASTLERVIRALQDFEDSSILIPKLKVTIGQLIKILKEENQRNFLLLSKYRNLTDVDSLLGDLVENVCQQLKRLVELRDVSEANRKLSDEALDTFFEQKNQLQIMRDDLLMLKRKRENYLQKCASRDIDVSKLESTSYKDFSSGIQSNQEVEHLLTLTEEQIMETISELETDITQKKRKLGENKTVLSIFQKERDNLEKQEPHLLEEHREEITQLLQKAETVSQRLLANYDSDIKKLIERTVKKEEVEKDPVKKKYYEEIARYLANRIGVFPHIDKKYRAKTVDLISGIIVTEDDTVIHVKDIGTGQSQSAYIMSLLNVPDDRRKIIALFDEIAMMDDKSLEPIRQKMRQLYESKRLLIGILVQKSEEFGLKRLA